MISSALRLFYGVLQRLATLTVILALALSAVAVWLFLKDTAYFDVARQREITALSVQREQHRTHQNEILARENTLRGQISHQQERHDRAGRVIETLHSLESFWQRWFGNAQQQKANQRQIQQLEKVQERARVQMEEANSTLQGFTAEKTLTAEAIERLDRQISTLASLEYAPSYYIYHAWRKARWWLLAGAALLLFGPLLFRAALYFGVAPSLARGEPLQLAPDQRAHPAVIPGETSIEVSLWPGEILRVRPEHLGAVDGAVARRDRWFLDARFPLSSVACGFLRTVELHHQHVGAESRVTVALPDAGNAQLAEVQIPEGGALIAPASSIIGLVTRSGQELGMRRRWRFFHWPSWTTRQFGFFEFAGPCRLLLAGQSAVRVDRLVAREGAAVPARRFSREATLAFTPNLEWRPARALRFLPYLRGKTALFDSVLVGEGVVLTHEAGKGSERSAFVRAKKRALRLVGI